MFHDAKFGALACALLALLTGTSARAEIAKTPAPAGLDNFTVFIKDGSMPGKDIFDSRVKADYEMAPTDLQINHPLDPDPIKQLNTACGVYDPKAMPPDSAYVRGPGPGGSPKGALGWTEIDFSPLYTPKPRAATIYHRYTTQPGNVVMFTPDGYASIRFSVDNANPPPYGVGQAAGLYTAALAQNVGKKVADQKRAPTINIHVWSGAKVDAIQRTIGTSIRHETLHAILATWAAEAILKAVNNLSSGKPDRMFNGLPFFSTVARMTAAASADFNGKVTKIINAHNALQKALDAADLTMRRQNPKRFECFDDQGNPADPTQCPQDAKPQNPGNYPMFRCETADYYSEQMYIANLAQAMGKAEPVNSKVFQWDLTTQEFQFTEQQAK